MDQTQNLLQKVAEGARTGAEACAQLMERTPDPGMRDELLAQRDQYENCARDAEHALLDLGGTVKSPNPATIASMWMGTRMNTLADATNGHIAEIAIRGATMGVIQATRDRNTCPDADANAQGIASAYITAQQDGIERMKQFL